ncbi:substrate-binding domain-containing protein [Pseudarthrobacter sp. HLT3-5]|uniref:substrate-binding domain-containing protein n=1 Tax=Pseudarthrobacter cellobiosi TaxID=2953654 RepID=UPI00208EF238|nr:substrate-binding domain-containing protein [Pseudarthrobacter sp. HLT3-5]MCO4273254.1 substrate-binding domain-containing protein [Pseudarthrobacter sp. HLT3-5]
MTRSKKSIAAGAGLLTAFALLLSGCSSDTSGGTSSASDGKAVVVDAASIAPAGIVGKGKNGEEPALVDKLQLSDADKKKVADGKFSVGISMNTMDIDWSRLTIEGIQKTLTGLGVQVVGVTDAKFKVQQQISDLENLITKKPDAIISIPTDDVATAATYKKVAAAGIKLIFIHMPASGLTYPADYQAVVAPDNQGNGEIAAAGLSKYIPQNGAAGIVDYGVDFYTTNQRTLRVKEWFKQNRPDVKVKTVSFTDTNAVGPVAANFMTANPDVKGLFVIWDSPAMQSVASLRNAGVNIPITTIDLGTEVAVEMANGGYIKAIGAQQPYDQGVAEALAAANALIGNKVPAWVALPPVAVTPGNLLKSYESIFHTKPPQEVLDACKSSGICG